MVVCKFGGSSVASASQLRKVKAIVDSDKNRKVVLVSAPGKRNKEDIKVTDLLYTCSDLVRKEGSCSSTFSLIRKRYLDILTELEIETDEMETFLDEVEKNINAGFGDDYAASRGEYLNAKLISLYFGWNFVDALDLIIINSNGTINEQTWSLLNKKLDENENYIIPGFYGRDENGKVKTFSRGGSDISGAILAKALNASCYENWTDVAGCYNADPRFIDGAYPIDNMTYSEVRTLSAFGASVFHAEAIAPVMKTGIPINIKNTNAPEAAGTMISLDREEKNPVIGVSKIDGYTRLNLSKLMLLKQPGVNNTLTTMLKVSGITPDFSFVGIDTITWFFQSSQASDCVLSDLKERFFEEFNCDSVEYKKNLSLIGLVGQGILKEFGVISKSTTAIENLGLSIDSMTFGMNNNALIYSVDQEKSLEAVQAVFDVNFK